MHLKNLLAVTLLLSCDVCFAQCIGLRGVEFKPNHPKSGETLANALKEPTQDSLQILQEGLDMLKRNPDLHLEILGHTDDQEGRANERVALSKRRAELVRDWLIAHGIAAGRLTNPRNFGSDAPADTNATAEGRQRNRRIEFDSEELRNCTDVLPAIDAGKAK